MTQPEREKAVDRALRCWCEGAPPWVLGLARACDKTNQAAVASRLGVSAATVNMVLGNRYKAGLSKVEARVRGAGMGETLKCPVLGKIQQDRCLDAQSQPFSVANPTRARLFGACRACNQFTPIKKGAQS